MEKIILFEDEHLVLEYVSQGNFIYQKWKGITPNKTFIKYLNIVLNLLEEKKIKNVLLDTREHGGAGPESQKIAAEMVGEYAKKNGKLTEAILVPDDVFAKFTVENYAKKHDTNPFFETRFFKDIDEAQAWLVERS